MYRDKTIPFSSHTLYNIVDPGQIRSSVYINHCKSFKDYPDKNLNLSVDLGKIRLFYAIYNITDINQTKRAAVITVHISRRIQA